MADKSELASLSDIALAKGVPHSQIISGIHDHILKEYKKLYPDRYQTVEVSIDEKSGTVRLMRHKEDVTPDEFRSVAERIAREVIIQKITDKGDEEPKIKKEDKTPKAPSKLGKWIVNIFFWGYNLIYIFMIIVFLVNFVINKEYRLEFIDTTKELGAFRLFFFCISIAIPLVTIYTAARLSMKKSYNKLGTLFFLFEVPLVLLTLILANIFQNPTPIMWLFLATLTLSVPVFLINILDIDIKSDNLKTIVLLTKEIILLLLGYLVLIFSFVTPLLLGAIVKEVSDFFVQEVFITNSSYIRHFNPAEFLITAFFGGFFILIILSLISGPYILLFSTVKSFLKSKKDITYIFGSTKTNRLVFGFAIFYLILSTILSYQPNPDKYINKLEEFDQMESFEKREALAKELLTQEANIKRSFEDLQNVRKLYIMAKSDEYIKKGYIDKLNFSELSASTIQDAFNLVAYPFVYQGNLDRNRKAITSFEFLFGKSLYYTSTFSGNKNVEVINRSIKAVTDYEGLIATIYVEEQYINSTDREQEVIYEFSLPSDSVIIDLKLGPSLEFPGTVAPRGAAVRTYQQEVNKNRDPALIEQAGPNQYRLRVFPIPAINSNTIGGKNQKVQFTYVTPITFSGFGLPQYTKEQNVKIIDTDITLNGIKVSSDNNYIENSEVSQALDKLCSTKNPIPSGSKLGNSNVFFVPNLYFADSQDLNCDANGISLLKIAKNLKIAVLYDVSYSNKNDHSLAELGQIINKVPSFLETNTFEIYKFNDLLSKPIAIESINDNIFEPLFFGTSNWPKIVSELGGNYDFAIVITNNYTAPTDLNSYSKKGFPVFIVHTGKIPPYASDFTIKLMQEGGSTFGSIQEAINTGILKAMKNNKNYPGSTSIGPVFSYQTNLEPDQIIILDKKLQIADPLVQLAARGVVNRSMSERAGDLGTQLSYLDTLNKFSSNTSIVTLYSSMIALVNERQIQNLQNQTQTYNRYGNVSTTALRNPNNIDLMPMGQWDSSISPLAMEGGSFGNINITSPVSILDSVGNIGSSGISLFILTNILILSGGVAVFIFIKFKKSFKRNQENKLG